MCDLGLGFREVCLHGWDKRLHFISAHLRRKTDDEARTAMDCGEISERIPIQELVLGIGKPVNDKMPCRSQKPGGAVAGSVLTSECIRHPECNGNGQSQ